MINDTKATNIVSADDEESYESVDFGDNEDTSSSNEDDLHQPPLPSPPPTKTMTHRVNINQFLESSTMFTLEKEELVPFLINIRTKMDIFTFGHKGGVTSSREIWWTVARAIDYYHKNTAARDALYALESNNNSDETAKPFDYNTFKDNLSSREKVQNIFPSPFVDLWDHLSALYFCSYMLHELLVPMAIKQKDEIKGEQEKVLPGFSSSNRKPGHNNPPFTCVEFAEYRASVLKLLEKEQECTGDSVGLFWALVDLGARHLGNTIAAAHKKTIKTKNILLMMRVVLAYVISFVKGRCVVLARARMKLVSSDTQPSEEVLGYIKYIYNINHND